MAYDLATLYSNGLSSNYLSKTIVDMLLKEKRFSGVSKITLPFSYGNDVTKDPIGYTETGMPIYDNSISVAMNDDIKASIVKMHDRNTDTVLRGIGTNIVENTSSGNIVEFRSNGLIKAIITETGYFTGKIKLSNIEDLDSITLDTTNFYDKTNINSLLSAKISKIDLFNSSNKIFSKYIDNDIVRVIDFNDHITNTDIHITSAERSAWNAKYDKPIGGISFNDLSDSVNKRINDSALNINLEAHTSNEIRHITAEERSDWNAKYDKPKTGIPQTDLSELVQTTLNNAVSVQTYNGHIIDNERHTNHVERDNWNAKYDKPDLGIPESDLETVIVDKLNNASTKIELTNHTNDKIAHTSTSEKNVWNAKYDKPDVGIPESDLDDPLRTKINSAALSDDLTNHINNIDLHFTPERVTTLDSKYDKPETGIPETDLDSAFREKVNSKVSNVLFNEHNTDSTKHITSAERSAWNAKYDKPDVGIPESDLTLELKNKIASFATKSSLSDHTSNTTNHITAYERTLWSDKYDKPETGIPETDLEKSVASKINNAISKVALDTHKSDGIKHITSIERDSWNAKYDKLETGIPETDLDSALREKLANKVDNTIFNEHNTDSTKHITSAERSAWNAKYSKSVDGIPEADLTLELKNKIASFALKSELNSHTSDSDIHITSDERTAWTAKYDKPADGIPETDLETTLVSKIDKSATKSELNSHTSDSDIHITSGERTAWTAKYDKPADGIPETDLDIKIRSKLSLVNKPYTKTIDVEQASTSFTIKKDEHTINHTFGYEYSVKAFKSTEDSYIEVKPSSFAINKTTYDITITFDSDFSGVIIIK